MFIPSMIYEKIFELQYNEKAKRQYFQQSFHFIFTPRPKREHICLHAGRCLGKFRWTKLGLFVLQLFQLNSCCIGKAIAQPHLYNIYHTRSFPTRRYFSRSTLRFLRATNPGPRNADSQHVRQNQTLCILSFQIWHHNP